MVLKDGFLTRGLLILVAPMLLGGWSLPWDRPPLVADFQALCLKSGLKPAAFLALAANTKGLTKNSSELASNTGDTSTTWTHRTQGRAMLVALDYRIGGHGVTGRSTCVVSDSQDKRASIDWLSRWTGSKVKIGTFVRYYLSINHGQARLFDAPGAGFSPPPRVTGDVYIIMIDSHQDSSSIMLGRSDSWWPSKVKAPLTPP